MNNDKLGKILQEEFGKSLARVGGGRWMALLEDGLKFQCMTDERADRMRFIIPVMPVGGAPKEFMQRLLEANFHSALDARYAVADGLVWSCFIHPLSSLTERCAKDAVQQVLRLAHTTGSTYSSCDLVFVGSVERGEAPKARKTAVEAFEDAVNVPQQEGCEAPPHLCDPLTFEVLVDPVLIPSGHTFERATIMEHIARFHNNPFTREPLKVADLTPNRAIQQALSEWSTARSESTQ